MTATRLRQMALVARDLGGARAELETGLGLHDPYADPGVGVFGLVNAVYEAGSDFVEVVAPNAEDTTAGRFLDRFGDGGYMAIFQLPSFHALAAARERAAALGIRVAWSTELDDIATCHLHPKDVPGAIVSLDAAVPPGSWRWGGPRWTGAPAASPYARGEIRSITVAVADPEGAAAVWSAVLDCALAPLPSGQHVRFVEGEGGIIDVELDLARPGEAAVGSVALRSL